MSASVSVGDVFEDKKADRMLHVCDLLWAFPRGTYLPVEVARVSNAGTGRISDIRVDRLLSSRYRRLPRDVS